jgi:hypothetical protein
MNNRMANASSKERVTLDYLIAGESPTLNVWPHDASIAGLLQSRIVKTLPNTLGNGMQTVGLKERAKRLFEKKLPHCSIDFISRKRAVRRTHYGEALGFLFPVGGIRCRQLVIFESTSEQNLALGNMKIDQRYMLDGTK